jgi:hypothetical protein
MRYVYFLEALLSVPQPFVPYSAAFANIYYEFNNPSLPAPFLKCAAYGDIHSDIEKTNFGGQNLGSPAGLTYIQQSSGYARIAQIDPIIPEGYELIFGPVNGSVQAPGVSTYF